MYTYLKPKAEEEIRAALEGASMEKLKRVYFGGTAWECGSSWQELIEKEIEKRLDAMPALECNPIAKQYSVVDFLRVSDKFLGRMLDEQPRIADGTQIP